jgi:hypothetical protein
MTDYNWQPKSKDDAWACWFYNDDPISAIADVLPGDVDRGVLTAIMRQWASTHIAMIRRESPDTAGDVRNTLKRAAAKLREATAALDKVPDIEGQDGGLALRRPQCPPKELGPRQWITSGRRGSSGGSPPSPMGPRR